MAKVPFSKLKCKINEEIKTVDFAGETIEIKQYLPIQEKLGLIGRVIMAAHEQDENYSNPVKIDVFTDLEIIFAYTNISFTEKQKEDLPKLYDAICTSGLLNIITIEIPESELNIIKNGVGKTSKAVYDHQNSAVGVIENLKSVVREYNIQADEVDTKLENLKNNSFIKELLPLIGLSESILSE